MLCLNVNKFTAWIKEKRFEFGNIIERVYYCFYTSHEVNVSCECFTFRVNGYGRDVTLDFRTNLAEFIYARISVCAFWWQAGTMCVYYEFVCVDI